ncbi:FAD binding domain-containing protein [Pseudoxanthomonas composti]|uniref:Xanthine dehydrogenase family protein subunit M n=1 Tax=Pseudoxanthomonas composti TaxID=2137479 RepID=A0A4Q1JR55_9GAMM|nr:xanthine dehydrogenase family protein subunit M [Pseudoxanthomonas composti]RXQ99919.1 xanthine dehydrogenase family protein subunit M [Pseudoxanthomonas composti]
MNPFHYVRAGATQEAVAQLARPGEHPARLIAGGTNLLDLMKIGAMSAELLIDINAAVPDALRDAGADGMVLGAAARNAVTAYDPGVKRRYPLLSAAILAGASPQIRNAASNAGNLLQRTRCYYFYDPATACNKRDPGSGCAARTGVNRQHAILGFSPSCIATHPSDMCVALAALEARVQVTGPAGDREIPFAEFHRLPGDRPELDTTLGPDEVITAIALPAMDQFAGHSAYLKVRDRLSYAFALVSVAAALALNEDGTIAQARLAVGGVAHRPWRVPAAEEAMVGQLPVEDTFAAAAESLLQGARGSGFNDFKIPLARRSVVRALQMAHEGTYDNTGAPRGQHP